MVGIGRCIQGGIGRYTLGGIGRYPWYIPWCIASLYTPVYMHLPVPPWVYHTLHLPLGTLQHCWLRAQQQHPGLKEGETPG